MRSKKVHLKKQTKGSCFPLTTFPAKLMSSNTQSCVLHLQQLCLLSPTPSLSSTLPRNMAPSALKTEQADYGLQSKLRNEHCIQAWGNWQSSTASKTWIGRNWCVCQFVERSAFFSVLCLSTVQFSSDTSKDKLSERSTLYYAPPEMHKTRPLWTESGESR